MKKLLFALLLCLSASSFAQSFHWGPRFGLNSASLSISDVDENFEDELKEGDNKLGFHIGLFSRVQLLGFYIQPELLYTNVQSEIRFGDLVSEVTINRIDLPVLVGKRFLKIARVQAGPVFSFPLSSEVGETEDVYDNVTVGYQAGIGLDLANLLVDLKYEGSFNNLADDVGGFDADQRVSQIILSVGWKM